MTYLEIQSWSNEAGVNYTHNTLSNYIVKNNIIYSLIMQTILLFKFLKKRLKNSKI